MPYTVAAFTALYVSPRLFYDPKPTDSIFPILNSYAARFNLFFIPRIRGIVAERGFEPLTFGLWTQRASRLLHPALFFYFVFPYKHDMWKKNRKPLKKYLFLLLFAKFYKNFTFCSICSIFVLFSLFFSFPKCVLIIHYKQYM